TAPAPALSAFNWFPKKSASTIESNPELRPQKLVALTGTVALPVQLHRSGYAPSRLARLLFPTENAATVSLEGGAR
ncbi:MAG: hypothetical protein ACLQVY_03020, partial [Limisphaerales bacterium]